MAAKSEQYYLAPQHNMRGMSISTRILAKTSSSISPDRECKVTSNITDYSMERRVTKNSEKLRLEHLVLNNKCPIHTMMCPQTLFRFASTSTSLLRHFGDLNFNFNVGFHNLACVIRLGGGFGVLKGCSLVVGADDENVKSADLTSVTRMLQEEHMRVWLIAENLMCWRKGKCKLWRKSILHFAEDNWIISVAVTLALPCSHVLSCEQSPKTQLGVTFVELIANLSHDVVETHVAEFIRSLRFPPMLTLTALNLEGSLIGARGVSHLCSVLRQRSLPNLAILNLNRNDARSTGLNSLCVVLCNPDCCPHLERLTLASNRAELSVLDLLCGKALLVRPALTHLDISDNNTCLLGGDAIVTMKSNKPRLSALRTLDLSFNPLEDAGMHALLSCAFPPSPALSSTSICSTSGTLPPGLQHLLLVNCNIGNNTYTLLGTLLKTKHFQMLETLSVGMNNGQGRAGIECLLEALCPLVEEQVGGEEAATSADDTETGSVSSNVPRLKHLLVPLNNFGDDGLLAVTSAATRGAFRHLETLDVSDIGASADSLSTFIRGLTQHVLCGNLLKLVVFGRHPFAQRSIRSNFPESFLRRVKVS